MTKVLKHGKRGSKEKDLMIVRILDAPRAAVWKAWTEPEGIMKWWGPENFTVSAARIDLRAGGKYLFCMRGAGPDGVVREYCSTGTYREIVPLRKIVCTDSFADAEGTVVPASHYGMSQEFPRETTVTVAFEDHRDGTKMTLQHTGIPEGEIRELSRQGWNGSFDTLERSLAPHGTLIVAEMGKQEIVITRVFEAPRQLLFRAYTDPKLIPEWWGSRRFRTVVDKMDVRPGGMWRFINRDRNGNEYAFHGFYHELSSPERIVCTFEFEGIPGHVELDTVSFEESSGRTKVTVRAVFQTVEERDSELNAGMREGAAESMDRLAQLLETMKKEKKAA